MSLWSDYAVRTGIAPRSRDTTATIGVRTSAAGSAEVLVGRRLVVRHAVGAESWVVDASVPLPASSVGLDVDIAVVGDHLRVAMAGQPVAEVSLPRELATGGVTLGASGTANPAVRYVTPAARPAS